MLAATLVYGAGVLVGKSAGYYDAQADGFAAEFESEVQRRLEQCFDQVPVGETQACVENAIAAGRVDQRAEQDLGAQRQMADWAFWLLAFTIAQAILGIFGFIALIITIRQGREANAIARENSHRELRAYLTADSVIIKEVDAHLAKYAMSLFIVNHGQTPGTISSVYFSAVWLCNKNTKIVIQETRQVRIKSHKSPRFHIEFPFNGAFEGSENSGNFMVVVRITYSDVFGKTESEQFGWISDTDPPLQFAFGPFPMKMAAISPELLIEMVANAGELSGNDAA